MSIALENHFIAKYYYILEVELTSSLNLNGQVDRSYKKVSSRLNTSSTVLLQNTNFDNSFFKLLELLHTVLWSNHQKWIFVCVYLRACVRACVCVCVFNAKF